MDEVIKPQYSLLEAKVLVEELYGLQVDEITELNSYDDKNYHVIVSSSTNKYMGKVHSAGYIFKIINSSDSLNESLADGQTALFLFLEKKNYPAPVPVKNINGQYHSLEKKENQDIANMVRLLEFQNGTVLKNVPGEYRLYFQVGVWLAKLDVALEKFNHPVFQTHTTMWHLKSAAVVKKYINVVDNKKRRDMVDEVILQFIEKIEPIINSLPRGMVHGDFNEQNLLVNCTEDGIWNLSGVIDFGDANLSCYLFEVGAAICYMMLEARRHGLDILQSGAEVLRGYSTIKPLTSVEFSLLKLAICSRLCQSLVLGLYSQTLQPENAYVGDTQEHGWAVLEHLWNTPDDSIVSSWS